jgi:transposase
MRLRIHFEEAALGGLFLLAEAEMSRIAPHVPLARSVPRVDDRRVASGMVFVIKHGLRRQDAPKA